MFDARMPARPPDHRHPHSNNQVSPCENQVNNVKVLCWKRSIDQDLLQSLLVSPWPSWAMLMKSKKTQTVQFVDWNITGE